MKYFKYITPVVLVLGFLALGIFNLGTVMIGGAAYMALSKLENRSKNVTEE
jgi:hypothetical protein